MNELKNSGIEIEINSSLKLKFFFNIYGILADTPGKSTIINMVQFNGKYGCPYCLNKGFYI